MGRKIDVELLVDAPEIARRVGLAHHQSVHSWRRRHADFPDPVVTLTSVLVWYWPDVEQWARRHGRISG